MTKSVTSQVAKMAIEAFLSEVDYVGMARPPGPRIPKEMEPEAIGARLRLVREAFGLKPAEMADALGIERTYWSRFEKGRRPINDETGYALVERFNLTFDFLLLGKMDKLPLDVAEKLRAANKPKT